MSADEITLTLPGDDAFHGVAHLVLGGLASRNDLTVETLEDLTLALDAVLERYGERSDEVTVLSRIDEDQAVIEIGPFPLGEAKSDLEREAGDALDTRRILLAVCDGVEVFERDGGDWVRLTKRVERATEAA
ncbi:MAG: hypothetical protein E6G64_08045 [Actinobacteria bacterium]|nr:MAG: hypothetical protein E6G64_08045 [Actinomycetota bacterium]